MLSPKNALKIREDAQRGVHINGLTWQKVTSCTDVLQLFEAGRQNMAYAETRMNKQSSRSHAVLQV